MPFEHEESASPYPSLNQYAESAHPRKAQRWEQGSEVNSSQQHREMLKKCIRKFIKSKAWQKSYFQIKNLGSWEHNGANSQSEVGQKRVFETNRTESFLRDRLSSINNFAPLKILKSELNIHSTQILDGLQKQLLEFQVLAAVQSRKARI